LYEERRTWATAEHQSWSADNAPIVVALAARAASFENAGESLVSPRDGHSAARVR
jgi:hypothetical protein